MNFLGMDEFASLDALAPGGTLYGPRLSAKTG
jgi:hypothetical protein